MFFVTIIKFISKPVNGVYHLLKPFVHLLKPFIHLLKPFISSNFNLIKPFTYLRTKSRKVILKMFNLDLHPIETGFKIF